MEFVPFHCHTGYSYGDGFGHPRMHVNRLVELGIKAWFVSEHGTTISHVQVEQLCKEAGIKPGYGCEIYYVPEGRERSKFHLGVYAMNEEGYRNLNKIITQSFIDSYQFPTVHWEVLERHNAGLAILSGCSDSLLSCTLLGGKSLGDKRDSFTDEQYGNFRREAERFQDVFGDRFYLEVQRFPGLDRTCALNPAYALLSADTGIPLIATADVHYPYPEQNEIQKVLHAGRNKSSVAITEAQWEYDILLTYPTSDQEIINDLIGTGLTESESHSALRGTTNLAERCTVELPKARPLRVTTGKDESGKPRSAKEELQFQLKRGWEKRVKQRPDLAKQAKRYFERIRTEFKVIADKDFSDYFLATSDLVTWAKSVDIDVGPGRGSAAGSVICYVLGITEIDPLHPTFQRMIFERFIDKNRSDMPDIDLDFDDERRLEIPARAREIYGNENVCNVANHQAYRGKSALNTVAKSYGLSIGVFDAIAKRCSVRVETDERVDDVISDVIETYSSSPDVAEILDRYPKQVELAALLEGSPNTLGRHAGGFVISSDPTPNVCPIYLVGEEGKENAAEERVQCIPYDKRDAEYLNMLKMDFLGLATMGMIGKIRRWTGMHLDDLYAMYYRDYEDGGIESEKIFKMFRDDDVMGIFQYEGGTTRQVVRDVQPQNFDELAACGALSRPGPLYGNQTEDYIAVKMGEKDWKRIHPTGFDRHVEWTYGQIVYQEQIMWILRDLAGFSTERVLKVRKIIGKKLGEFQFAQLWEEFRDGCSHNNVSEQDAARVWSAITTAAGYAFNTAHAYSYALIAWWQMYFKIHRVPEFFASSLAKNGDLAKNIPRRTALLKDAIAHDVQIGKITPSSDINWTPSFSPNTPNLIHPGLVQIPKVSENTARHIMEWREKLCEPELWYVIDWDDMKPPVSKSGVFRLGEESVEKIKSFVNADDPFGVFRTEKQLGGFRAQSARGDFEQYGLPNSELFVPSNFVPTSNDTVAFVGLVRDISEKDEVEIQRQRTGKPVEEIKARLEADCLNTRKATLYAYDEFGDIALRCSRFLYEELADRIGEIEKDHHVVVAWGRVWEGRPGAIQLKDLWVLEPDD